MFIRTRSGYVALLALLLAVTAGCSDDDAAVAGAADTEPPAVSVTYPSATNGGTDASEIIIRGVAEDPSGIEFITVNDVAVTTDDDFATWTVTLPLAEGANDLKIARLDKAGNGITGNDMVISRLGEIWNAPTAITNAGSDKVYVADSDRSVVFEVLVSNGKRRIISGPGIGSGPDLADVRGIEYDTAGPRVLVADAGLGAVVAINLTTGDRLVLSDLNTGSGPPIDAPDDIVSHTASQRVFVLSASQRSVLAIDINTGDRTVLSDDVTGAGALLERPMGIALDENNGRLLVTDTGADPAVIGIDLGTGDRSVISSSVIGGGAPIGIPPSIITDPSANVAYITDVSSGSVVQVDLATGNRVLASGVDLGEGPYVSSGDGIVYDLANNQLLVVDSVVDALVGIDLGAGDRSYVSNLLDVGEGPRLVNVTGMSPKWDAAVIVDAASGSISKLPYGSGDRNVRSDDVTGSGPMITGATDVAMDLDAHDSYVTDDKLQALVVVDYDSGDRTIVSDANTGSGAMFQQPSAVTLDIKNDRVFIADPPSGAIFTIAVSSGARTILTDAMSGSGPPLLEPIDVDYDYKAECLLALDGQSNDLFLIDVNTGERHIVASCLTSPKQLNVYGSSAFVSSGSTVEKVDIDAGTCTPVANANLGSGPPTLDIDGIVYSPDRNSVFVNSKSLNAIIQIDATSGDRMIVAK